jgi:hypothetical protein
MGRLGQIKQCCIAQVWVMAVGEAAVAAAAIL